MNTCIGKNMSGLNLHLGLPRRQGSEKPGSMIAARPAEKPSCSTRRNIFPSLTGPERGVLAGDALSEPHKWTVPPSRIRYSFRSLLIVVIGFSAWVSMARETGGWKQDFEDRVPGQSPLAWSVEWGTRGEDLLLVSNLRACGGTHALLLDRTGPTSDMWGIATCFPNHTEGWQCLSFAFLVQGAGHDARFGFEIRTRLPSGRRICALGFSGSKLKLTPMSEMGNHRGRESVELGRFEKDVWGQVEVWLPALTGAEPIIRARLSRMTGDGAWEPAGPVAEIPAFPPTGDAVYGQLMLVTSPGARGYRLFIDDLQTTSSPFPQ